MRSYKYQFSNFSLDLKIASTKLEHIRIHEFLCFLYIGQVSKAFQQRKNSFHILGQWLIKTY